MKSLGSSTFEFHNLLIFILYSISAMAHQLSLKRKAQDLRSRGYSYREISHELAIAKATAYAWTNRIYLNDTAQKILKSKTTRAQQKASESNMRKRQERVAAIERKVIINLTKVKPDKLFYQILTSTLYWGEGSKYDGASLAFVNSDPEMIRVYMHSFRRGFKIDETKFRANVQIHEYHDELKIRKFWSDITQISVAQFTKSYVKPNTGIHKRKDYKGCIRVTYYDMQIAVEIRMIYNKLPDILGVW